MTPFDKAAVHEAVHDRISRRREQDIQSCIKMREALKQMIETMQRGIDRDYRDEIDFLRLTNTVWDLDTAADLADQIEEECRPATMSEIIAETRHQAWKIERDMGA